MGVAKRLTGYETVISLLLILGACTPALHKFARIDWTPVEPYAGPDLRDLVGTTPAPVVAGDPAPFDGFVVTADDWKRVRDEVARLQGALEDCYAQGRGDRILADAAVEYKVELLRGCEVRAREAFLAGCGICAGGAAALDRVVDEATTP